MRGELVALDLETTGLDTANDSIIEIGAVRLKDGEIVAEYTQLVNPGFVIPAETTHITGIHQDDLRNAPMLSPILPTVEQFVGDAPVIAHNVSFDMTFMRRFGILHDNLPIDTLELSTSLLPRAPRYSLSSLAEQAGIDLENAHRALDDARATAILYWHLWEKALTLPEYILYEISRAVQEVGWETGAVFQAAYEQVRGTQPTNTQSVTDVFAPLEKTTKPLDLRDDVEPVDPAAIAAAIDETGDLAAKLPRYEQRPQQIEMAQAVMQAFNDGTHLMIEAGTGTGKSIAYLVPAMRWAVKNQQRVVISTNTINLQEQLINKDVPLVQEALNISSNAAIMKGRSNYLCPRRLAAVRRRRPNTVDELRTMTKILVWLQESQTGDKGELSLRSGEYYVWNRLSAEDEGCAMHRCESTMRGICPFYKARKRAEAAHIVVANHALLISDAVTDSRVLPEYSYLVVDEAHQLEDAITYGMSQRTDQRDILRRLDDLGGLTSGVLGELMGKARDHLPDKPLMRLEAFIKDISDAIREMQQQARTFYNVAYNFIDDSGSSNNYKIRIDTGKRNHHAFSALQQSWQTLDEYFEAIVEAIEHLADALRRMGDKYDLSDLDDDLSSITASASNLAEIRQLLHRFLMEPDNNTVYWINNGSAPEWISLEAAPLHVGPLMEQFIWHKKDSAVLTSATLTTADSFDFIHDRLYAEGVRQMSVGSPFDYRKSTLVYIPDDIDMPNQRGYQRAVERGIVELAAALDGRVMALFTSYSQIRETVSNIAPRLALGNITLYDQATGGSRDALLENFKSTEKAVLLGTRSFWEGVDIPGDDLSALVIVRLPFAVPNEPVFAARSTSYSDPFNEYTVPDAILRFRQGFGRLIRSQSDKGIVAILDSRIIDRSYGKQFLDSLPDCTIEYGKLEELGNAAKRWLE